MELEYLPISSSEIPIEKDFTIGETYSFRFLYNERSDFYTCTILDSDANILFTTKICYARELIDAKIEGLEINRLIIPLNPQEIEQSRVLQGQIANKKMFGNDILLILGRSTEE
ncbi:hypothetical protein CH352_14415 [Leptospira hartskeerlii]|uniref:Cyanophage baseplate Pam3 plug gp18 domain-containing protein n=1 Tax=Leptospira hartskeerlii TaxID=2023177 RepID=A0A2M9XA81_9LEPT|nr:hypothetical protein CH357_15090 [Leptospira hartskeerlii]PJZ33016.1 hypothetical protein CH352_14415 [Leptospira hartskeerlii]